MIKLKNAFKKSATLLMSFMFLLMTNVFITRADENTKSVHGVKVTVTTDKESYTVSEANVNATVTFENTNPYEVTVKSAELTSDIFFEDSSSTKIPEEITLGAGKSDSYKVTLAHTVTKWAATPLKFVNPLTGNEESINVGVRGSKANIDPSWTFTANVFDSISADDKEKYSNYWKLLDTDKQGAEHVLFFDFALVDGTQAAQTWDGYIQLMIQKYTLPEGERGDFDLLHLYAGEDEEFVEVDKTVNCNGTNIDCRCTNIKSFSPYALLDPKEDTEPKKPESTKCGDDTIKVLLPLVMCALLFSAVCLCLSKKRRRTVLSVVMCAGLGISAVVGVASVITCTDQLKFPVTFNDYKKIDAALTETSERANTAIDVKFSVNYDGPELDDIVYDYDDNYDYFGGPFHIQIKGGPAGWLGDLYVYDKDGTQKSTHEVNFAKLTVRADGTKWFEFDPIQNSDDSDELDVGDILKLIDKHGHVCDTVTLEAGDIQDE